MWYSSDPHSALNMTSVPVERVKEIITLNAKGVKPLKLVEFIEPADEKIQFGYGSVIEQDSLTRFDEKKKRKPAKKRRNKIRRRPGNE